MSNVLSLKKLKAKRIFDLNDNFRGKNPVGEEISFTNYYMLKDGRPFYGVSGEFHFARMSDIRWEDEIIKMKMAGFNVVATYLFWIHHEEVEGVFDFSGRRNVRRFVELCQKHGMYVILRVGPFDHGEVRNGGIPDWMYGKPFEVRRLNEGFLYHTRCLYIKIAEQIEGLFYKDGGPIIGVQIDNEYMHSAAPWELTAGISKEWIFVGDEGDEYMLRLKDLAAECGLRPVFYTCTGWGGAATPDAMMPLWGGYAFRPWSIKTDTEEHPATDEYVYQDFHNNNVVCNYDFHPVYNPEDKPYACCEMGGGMSCSYNYRFQYPYKSVDAMANIKIASGCNFLGYYMFQGGSNPLGINGNYLSEGQVPKISYDYQAALGEFGQVRESYRRLKNLHFFVATFKDKLCKLQTVLPEGASDIDPYDADTLRYAVRTDGKSGFLFVNNYQDHAQMKDKVDAKVTLQLEEEDIVFKFDIAVDENVIMPFHFDMEGIDLVQATAQPITKLENAGEITYVFFTPAGMRASFIFEEGVCINGQENNTYFGKADSKEVLFTVIKNEKRINVLVINRELADQMYLLSDNRLAFSESVLLEDENGIRMETYQPQNRIMTYPKNALRGEHAVQKEGGKDELFSTYEFCTEEHSVAVKIEQVGPTRYTITLSEELMVDMKDALLQIDYTGDIGNAYIDGKMINDNFCNGATWEIGLKDFAECLKVHPVTIYITPLKEGAYVNVESPMAGRKEEVDFSIGMIQKVTVQPVYEIVVE